AGVAMALLLGGGNTPTAADWEKHQRIGVIHIFVILGKQLVVLAAFFWVVVRPCRLRRKRAALSVGLFQFAYTVLTGGHPLVLRAAVTVAVGCGALLLRRPVLATNALALAWLVVLALNPADVADVGCQLSFLCIALMTWEAAIWRGIGFVATKTPTGHQANRGQL
ncbi:MAG: competence protein ComEC, partial [Trebonia sp.]|nr:competence protein ComEC [Trebonia sp.]